MLVKSIEKIVSATVELNQEELIELLKNILTVLADIEFNDTLEHVDILITSKGKVYKTENVRGGSYRNALYDNFINSGKSIITRLRSHTDAQADAQDIYNQLRDFEARGLIASAISVEELYYLSELGEKITNLKPVIITYINKIEMEYYIEHCINHVNNGVLLYNSVVKSQINIIKDLVIDAIKHMRGGIYFHIPFEKDCIKSYSTPIDIIQRKYA